jgi:hypothetical protein
MKNIIFLSLLLFIAATAKGQTFFKNNKGLWGLKDKTGKVLLEPQYRGRPNDFSEGRSVFYSKGFVGVIDERGREIAPPVYTSITNYRYGFALAHKEITDTVNKSGGKPSRYTLKGVLDKNGKEIVPVIYRDLEGSFDNGWFVKVVNDKKEKLHINTLGQIFTVPDGILLMNDRVDGKNVVAYKNSKYGLVNQQFKEVLPFEYSRITPTNDGMLIAGKDGLFGLMDSKLKWIVKPTFTGIFQFQQGYAIVTDADNKYGAINAKGVVTTKPQFEKINRVGQTNSAIALYKGAGTDRWGLVNLATGTIITPAGYNMYAFDYAWGIIKFSRDGKKGMMDSTGKELFYGQYDDFSPGFNENRAWVMKDKKYGFIDKTGALVIPIQYDMIGGFMNGLAKIKQNGKYGYINLKGDVVIPVQFKDAENFEEGIAWVREEGGRSYYIDKTGKELN